MNFMFYEATSFNQDLSSWDTSNIINMSSMFNGASSYNQDLSSWNVDNVNSCDSFNFRADSWTLPKPNLPSSCLN